MRIGRRVNSERMPDATLEMCSLVFNLIVEVSVEFYVHPFPLQQNPPALGRGVFY